MIRTYTELKTFESFEERYNYLKLSSHVGRETFGTERYLNQSFYHSKEWLDVRNYVIVRDLGLDLGCVGYEFHGTPIVHHMNPIKVEDFYYNLNLILDPEFLITVSKETHDAIHYGVSNFSPRLSIERKPFDTIPWKQ